MYPGVLVVQFVFLQCVLVCLYGQTIEDANRLHGYLFNNSRYNINVRPIMNQSLHIKVSVMHVLTTVESFDISKGFLEVSGYLQLSWQDEVLVWDPASYSGIQIVSLSEGTYWVPEVTNYGITSQSDPLWTTPHVLAYVNYTGQVSRFLYENIIAKCTIDTSLFPFDSHECIYQFYFPKYLNTITIQLLSNYVVKFQFTENLEWEIKENSSSVKILFDASGKYSSNVYYSRLVIKRRPTFILLHQFLPSFILVTLNLLTNIVPLDSGERLSYCVTIFLAFIFLMGTMVDELPASSLHISISSYAFVVYNILSALTVIWSVICVRLSSLDSKNYPIPNWLQIIVLWNKYKRISSTLYPQHVNEDIDNNLITEERHEITNNKQTNITKNDPKISDTSADIAKRLTWFEIASFLDKIYFIAFLSVTFILLMAVLIFIKFKGAF